MDELAGRELAEMLKERARPQPVVHADGVHFNLPEDAYRDDPALGSSAMKQLALAPCDYWYTSHLNPDRPPDKDSEAQKRGTALHVLAFQGEQAFDRRYMRGPEHEAEMSPAAKGALTKAANREAAERGLILLPALTYDRIAIVARKLLRNPYLVEAFSGGAGEVSVFWTETHVLDQTRTDDRPYSLPIRKKARLDYLKPRGIGDLKSVANQFELPFARACINAITNYYYHVQAGHYLTARARMPAMLAQEQITVWGEPLPPKALLDGLVREKNFAWEWVFWQAERAPITWSRVLSPGNPMLEMAQSVIRRAEQNYLRYMQRFGPTELWIEEDKPEELFVEDMPPWFGRD